MKNQPSLSRRSVLAAFATGLGTLTLRPTCLLAAPNVEADFLVLSDTHLGRKDNDSAERQFRKTAEVLAAAPEKLILHLGDVVDGGRGEQYPIYQAIAEKIEKPIHAIPGNHDPADLFAKHIRRDIDTVVDHRSLRFVLLSNAHRDSHDGFLEDQQLDWLNDQCAAAEKDKRHVIVCMHVPAHTNRNPDRGWYVKPEHGQKRLYEVLAKHQEIVIALFHGHFHNGIRGWDDTPGVHEILFPSALYNQNRNLTEKKAPGYNLDEFRPGVTRVKIADGKMTLQYLPIGEDASVTKECKL